MARYDAEEQTTLYKNLYGKLTKNIRKLMKKHHMDDIEDCIKVAQWAWKETTDELDSPTIEISTVLSNLYGFHEDLYQHGISKSKLGDFVTATTRDDAADIDGNSRKIAMLLYNKISKVCGFEEYKTVKYGSK